MARARCYRPPAARAEPVRRAPRAKKTCQRQTSNPPPVATTFTAYVNISLLGCLSSGSVVYCAD
eukprot:9311289-Lingulodinium_polyedra.AAC.1